MQTIDEEDADRICRLVAHRVPELKGGQIAAALGVTSAEFADLTLEALDAIAERINELVMRLDDARQANLGRDRAAA